MGRLEESIPAKKKATELDPLSLWLNAELGSGFRLARRYDEAQEQLKKTIEMDPNFGLARFYMGMLYENVQGSRSRTSKSGRDNRRPILGTRRSGICLCHAGSKR